MRILKTKRFAKAAKDEGLTDRALKKAIDEFEQGLRGSELGGGLYKKRVAAGGKGKRGGLRTILVHKTADDKVFCIYVFAKSERVNIKSKELETFKETAKYLLEFKDADVEKAIKEKILFEVDLDGN